jgi:hypothetical protein
MDKYIQRNIEKYRSKMSSREDVRSSFKENLQWLSDISSEVEKFTSQSSFFVPKTPTVKRKLRKRGPINNFS